MSRKKTRNQGDAGAARKPLPASHQPVHRKNRKHDRRRRATPSNPVSLPAVLIILAYILITTFTPNLMSLDTNAPKFTALSVLNLLAFIYLLLNKDIRNHPGYLATFFTTKIGLAYSGLLLLSLISFFQAINILESVVTFSKLFTIFSAAFILSVLFTRDLRLIRITAIFFTGVLLFDAFSVFYYINQFIDGRIPSIFDIKSVYSNKNILASALFIKIPFALWLVVFEKGWLRRIAWLAVMTGIAATFFMIARAFYVGLIFISLLFAAYSLINYFRERQKQHLMLLGGYLGALVLAYAIVTFTQNNFYPGAKPGRTTSSQVQEPSREVGSITDQISSISPTTQRLRLSAWSYSWLMIKANPLLGVGTGNWKINVLEHENQRNTGFIYLYKAHNDFLETATETGIPGGLLYLGIYLFVGWAFLRAYFHLRKSEALYKYLFLAASGLVFYFFDAFFNFPHDRPEIMILFASFVAAGISTSYYLNRVTAAGKNLADESEQESRNIADRSEAFLSGARSSTIAGDLPATKPGFILAGKVIALVMMVPVAWVLYTNFQSTITQRIVFQEIQSGKLQEPYEKIASGLPSLPDISIWGEPINVLKARYLINEQKYQETIDLLRNEKTNPWDARREFFMAVSFSNLNEPDSVIKYALKVFELKPFYPNNILMAIDALEKKGDLGKVEELVGYFLEKEKREANVWIAATNFYNRHDNLDKALELIDEALERNPRNELINQQHTALHYQKTIAPHAHLFEAASADYRARRYSSAISYLNEFLEHVPDHMDGIRTRAFSYYHSREFAKCVDDVNLLSELGDRDPIFINLRGACYRMLGDLEAACRDFEESKNAGNQSGIDNYNLFCLEKE